MTDILTRPASPPRTEEAQRQTALSSVWGRGALSALWVASVGCAALVVVALIAWAADSRSAASAGAAIRTALQVWLAGHRVPLRIEAGTLVMAPLGVTLALGWLVARAAAILARGQDVDSPRGVAVVAAAVAVPYAVLAAFVAAGAQSGSVRPEPAVALVDALLLGVLAAAWGAARGVGLVRSCWALLPREVAKAAAGGAAATGVLLFGGTLLVTLGLATHATTAWSMVGDLGGGGAAAAVVVALDLVLLPNAALAAVGYLTGPGFAVGSGTTVSIGAVHAGALPALPLFAAVPRTSAGAVVEVVVLAAIVGAGVVAAAVVVRLGERLLRTMAWAAASGGFAGVFVALLVAVASGSAGPGRMSAVGASAWQTGLAAAAEVTVVACGAAGAMTWRRGR